MEFSLENWTAGYAARLHEIFPGRVLFIGLQGSRARGEAGRTATSTWWLSLTGWNRLIWRLTVG